MPSAQSPASPPPSCSSLRPGQERPRGLRGEAVQDHGALSRAVAIRARERKLPPCSRSGRPTAGLSASMTTAIRRGCRWSSTTGPLGRGLRTAPTSSSPRNRGSGSSATTAPATAVRRGRRAAPLRTPPRTPMRSPTHSASSATAAGASRAEGRTFSPAPRSVTNGSSQSRVSLPLRPTPHRDSTGSRAWARRTTSSSGRPWRARLPSRPYLEHVASDMLNAAPDDLVGLLATLLGDEDRAVLTGAFAEYMLESDGRPRARSRRLARRRSGLRRALGLRPREHRPSDALAARGRRPVRSGVARSVARRADPRRPRRASERATGT